MLVLLLLLLLLLLVQPQLHLPQLNTIINNNSKQILPQFSHRLHEGSGVTAWPTRSCWDYGVFDRRCAFSMHIDVRKDMQTRVNACIFAYVHTYMHTYRHACVHICMHTYILTLHMRTRSSGIAI